MTKALTSFATLLCICLSIPLPAQSLSQAFLHQNTNHLEAYSFSPNGNFSWLKFSGANKEYGSGKYSIHNNTITLTFQPAPRELDLQVEKSSRLNNKSARIDIHALYSSGTPFPDLKAIVGTDSVATDKNGVATLTIANAPANGTIHFEVNGYRTLDLSLQLRGWQNVYGFVVDSSVRYRENETHTFGFIQSKKKLQLSDGSTSLLFKKIRKKKFLDLSRP